MERRGCWRPWTTARWSPVWPDWLVPADDRWEDDGLADPPVALMTTIVAMTARTSPTGIRAVITGCRRRNDFGSGARPAGFFAPEVPDRAEVALLDERFAVGLVGPELDFDM